MVSLGFSTACLGLVFKRHAARSAIVHCCIVRRVLPQSVYLFGFTQYSPLPLLSPISPPYKDSRLESRLHRLPCASSRSPSYRNIRRQGSTIRDSCREKPIFRILSCGTSRGNQINLCSRKNRPSCFRRQTLESCEVGVFGGGTNCFSCTTTSSPVLRVACPLFELQ